jgi:hypothetical protein
MGLWALYYEHSPLHLAQAQPTFMFLLFPSLAAILHHDELQHITVRCNGSTNKNFFSRKIEKQIKYYVGIKILKLVLGFINLSCILFYFV